MRISKENLRKIIIEELEFVEEAKWVSSGTRSLSSEGIQKRLVDLEARLDRLEDLVPGGLRSGLNEQERKN